MCSLSWEGGSTTLSVTDESHWLGGDRHHPRPKPRAAISKKCTGTRSSSALSGLNLSAADWRDASRPVPAVGRRSRP